MDIKALQWELAAYVVDRDLDPLHTPKNLSMALAAEAGALLDLFKWTPDDGAQGLGRHDERDAAADAIADAVLHAVHLADRLGIDLEEAIRRKLAKNAEKYPAPNPEPAPVPERRAEPEKRPAPPRARAAPEPEMPARVAPRPASSPPREPPWVTRTPSPAPVVDPPPPARATRYEAPPPPPRPARAEPPPPPPPPPAARPEPPPPPPPEPEPEPEPEVDPYANLDVDAARRIVEVLTKQVNRARSDDPLARELHDELSTLKRSLYSDNPKRAWLAGSLKSIRRILEEACSLAVGAELRAKEHLAEVERILDA